MSFSSVTAVGRRLWGTLFPAKVTPQGRPAPAASQSDLRREQYRLLEAFADQSIWYRPDAAIQRENFSCYKRTRPLYSPCSRIVEFHRTHLMGGQLDVDAGPGGAVPTCLPVIPGRKTDGSALAEAVASIWAASNWQIKKALYTGIGATCGDVGLEAIADEQRGRVRLRVVHPGEVKSAALDDYGNVRTATLERWVADPIDPARMALYREEIVNDGGTVEVRTYRDDLPFAWPGTPGKAWEFRWGFVPLVLVKHIDEGGEWGVSEIRNALARSAARDSQGALLSDQVECAVIVQWLLTGADIPVDPVTKKKVLRLEAMGAAEGQRDNVQVITCTAKDAQMTPLVFPLAITEALEHGRSIGLALEADYPELRIDPVGVNASGEARRESRRQAEAKVIERRAAYDAGLKRAQEMAVTMGATLGFPAFAGFTPASFDDGKTDHRIGARPVFGVDPLDVLAERKAEGDAIAAYVDGGAGLPLPVALEKVGWTKEQIEEVKALLAEGAALDDQFRADLPALAIAQ